MRASQKGHLPKDAPKTLAELAYSDFAVKILLVKKKSVVKIDPGILSGTPCFAGTRVPVRALLDYIEGGETLGAFLDQYPTVTRKQAVGFLEESASAILDKPLAAA